MLLFRKIVCATFRTHNHQTKQKNPRNPLFEFLCEFVSTQQNTVKHLMKKMAAKTWNEEKTYNNKEWEEAQSGRWISIDSTDT